MTIHNRVFGIVVIFFIFIAGIILNDLKAITFENIKDKNLPLIQRINSITFDVNGYLWMASKSNLWRFDGYKLKSYDFIFNNKIKNIKRINIDQSNNLWIGTSTKGLYKYNIDNNTLNNPLPDTLISAIEADSEKGMWFGTSTKLLFLSNNYNESYTYIDEKNKLKNIYITSILDISNNELLIGTKKALLTFDKNNKTFSKIAIRNVASDIKVIRIYKDADNTIWVGTHLGLFFKSDKSKEFIQYQPGLIDSPITDIVKNKDNLWIGSFGNGLYRVANKNEEISHYTYQADMNKTLSSNTIVSFAHDNTNEILWVNTFSNSINYINTKNMRFGVQKNNKKGIYCSNDPAFGNMHVDKLGHLWLSTNNGLIKYNIQNKLCENFNLDFFGNDTFTTKALKFHYIAKDKSLWLATSKGLNKFNYDTNLIDTSYEKIIDKNITFIFEKEAGKLLIGTLNGLFQYDLKTSEVMSMEFGNILINKAKFYSYSIDKNKNAYFVTNAGIAMLSADKRQQLANRIQKQLPTFDLLSIYISQSGDFWIGTQLHGLYQFSKDGSFIAALNNENSILPKSVSILDILEDKKNNIWAATTGGLLRLNIITNKLHMFFEGDGLQGDYFSLNSAHIETDGKLYFGGRNGFNFFYPEDIKINTNEPNIVITEFTRFGKPIISGISNDGFVLEKDINALNKLTLGYKDYVVGFEFAALDFSDSNRNKYAYMMEGLDPEWIYTDADNRRISYSNLKPGEYTFKVKGSNKDGVWNENGKALKIIMKPAPWFTWWAYVIYSICVYCMFSWYFKWRNHENELLTQMLKTEVSRQTTELKTQKQKVENLLARKNEMFANVSHEFRTPLTLILGPINKLLNSHLPHTEIKTLKMINRNANRLLTMVEQLLQLTKVSDNENIIYYPIKTSIHIQTIVESFEHLAQEKRIDLQLIENDNSAISTSKDALEIVLGNLLSNAIKYTQSGGNIRVSSILKDNRINIKVTDTGCGLDKQQQKDIFTRFKRLDSHQNIEGVGIGLSVVEEIIKHNNATLRINSSIGEGTDFIVSFETIKMDFEEEFNFDNTLIKQLTNENTEIRKMDSFQQKPKIKSKETVVIIDDNQDMRLHIADSINQYYHCLVAEGGKEGIAMAIKHVPDIIISDVMMPEMDGFHVARVLRSDTRTSHIPLILLTALDDKDSRIRGWREHVDVYLTKPFDAQELLLQLENIIVIRNILKNKAGQKIKVGESSVNIDLPKNDQKFIDKLNKNIIRNYKDSNYLRPQMASDMAVSERQLQRKIKALIDKNPMDLLREYRLSQAAILLKDGYQVSISADTCGFNSLPHFSKCFKSQYGLSPKNYQRTINQS